MARPRKSRTLEGIPRPVIFIPSGWTRKQTKPVEVAIEDFEVMRLVDGHAYTIEEAAVKVGVAKSTAGRMLERARRLIALGMEKRAPIYLDALESSVLRPPVAKEDRPERECPDSQALAVAVRESDGEENVSRIFGRTAVFAIYRKGRDIEYLENPGFGSRRDAALEAIRLLEANKVGRVVAGRFGPEALEQLGRAGIDAVIAVGVSLEQAIELFGSE